MIGVREEGGQEPNGDGPESGKSPARMDRPKKPNLDSVFYLSPPPVQCPAPRAPPATGINPRSSDPPPQEAA